MDQQLLSDTKKNTIHFSTDSCLQNTIQNKTTSFYQPIKDKSNKALLWSILAYFIGFSLVVFFYSQTLIDLFSLSKFYVGFAVIGFLIPLRLYSKWFHIIKYEMIIINLIGIGPLLTGIFLLLNFIFSSNPKQVTYEIRGIEVKGMDVHLDLSPKISSENQKIKIVSDLDFSENAMSDSVEITTAHGLFGYIVIKNRRFIK